jgi:hypothetical protein
VDALGEPPQVPDDCVDGVPERQARPQPWGPVSHVAQVDELDDQFTELGGG